jgi:hypothetical protein
MKGRVTGAGASLLTGLTAAALLSGCAGSSTSLQDLLALPFPGQPEAETAEATRTAGGAGSAAGAETGTVGLGPGRHEPHQASAVVAGTPTGVFADVARGALGCWFAADGPLKATHVYRAEAQPPAKGGDAEIVVHERDGATRDLRGARAYRIAFTAELSNVRVTMVALRFEPKVAQAMEKDVASWAKGGEGCELKALLAPPPSAASKTAKKPTKTAKGQPPTKAEATSKPR